MVRRRKPLRLTRAEEEMVRAIRECRRRGWWYEYGCNGMHCVIDEDGFEYRSRALPAAVEKAKEAGK